MRRLFSRLWGSIAFRLTLNYGLLAISTTLILILFIYVQFNDALRTEYTRQIVATSQRLTTAFEQGGRPALISAIEFTLSDVFDADREIYLLLDEHGNKLAGNLETTQHFRSSYTRVFQTEVIRDGESKQGYLKIQNLPGGETLIVGLDLSDMDAVASLIGQATAAAIILAVFLVLLGAYLFRGALAYRVSGIRRTTQQIGAGRLSERVPASADEDEDEFTLLNRDFNMMLDRIEYLMKSARHISDTIAHNLRTPLTRIVGGLRAAQQPGASMADVLAANQQAIDGIERLNNLFGKLLQIAESEAGIRRRSFKPCELNVVVADVIEMYETLAEDNGIVIRHGALDEITLQGDANLLASALANLVDNAVKHAKREIVIAVTLREGTARVVIEDDGPGVPVSDYEHLGKHFYRVDPAAPGHGLGLTSVLSIVDLHGGTLDFSDAQPGLRVTVLLPLQ